MVTRFDFNNDGDFTVKLQGYYVEYNDYEKLKAEYETQTAELKEKIKQLRHNVWLKDIPHPKCPEYIELHESIQSILKEIDLILE